MEHQKKKKLLNKLNDSKFVAITRNIAKDQSNANYDVGHFSNG